LELGVEKRLHIVLETIAVAIFAEFLTMLSPYDL